MTNRLDYQTTAGSLDASITFEQLIEFCRRAQEDCRELASWAKIQGSKDKAKAWTLVGNNFEKIISVVAHLGKGKTKASVGFRQ